MKSLVEEFLDDLGEKSDAEQDLFAAIQLLVVCRDYVETHYKNAIFGTFQKNLLELLNEFLDSQKRKEIGKDTKGTD